MLSTQFDWGPFDCDVNIRLLLNKYYKYVVIVSYIWNVHRCKADQAAIHLANADKKRFEWWDGQKMRVYAELI